jgi:hypothetical protein
MPHTAYIVCSASGSADQYNGAVSCFSLLEALRVSDLPILPSEDHPQGVSIPLMARISLAWIKEDGDGPEHNFHVQIFIIFPDGHEMPLTDFPPFAFATRFHRQFVPMTLFPRIEATGFVSVEARIRRVGEEQWLARQSYSFFVELAQTPAPGQAPS